MKFPPHKAGFLQAAGLALYVALFATAVWSLPRFVGIQNAELHQVVAMSLFLLTFVTSASICGSIMFGYPTRLFLDNKKKEAVHTVLWSILWLVVILATVAACVLIFAPFLAVPPRGTL